MLNCTSDLSLTSSDDFDPVKDGQLKKAAMNPKKIEKEMIK